MQSVERASADRDAKTSAALQERESAASGVEALARAAEDAEAFAARLQAQNAQLSQQLREQCAALLL